MGFQKGKPRHPDAGRKKGTPNKRSTVEEVAFRLGVNPFEVLLNFAKGDWEALGYPSSTMTRMSQSGEPYEVERISPELRMASARDAIQYLEPKKKALEITIPSAVEQQAEEFNQLPKEQQVKLLESELKRLKGEV